MHKIGNKKNGIITLTVLAVGFLSLVGCEPKFDMTSREIDPLPAQSNWKITSSGGRFLNLRGAIDGNPTTMAISGRRYRNTSVTVDLGRRCLLNVIALRHGLLEHGFARKVSLSTSLDGKNFTKQYQCAGTRKVTYIPVLTPITARYIRITAVSPGSEPWAISEIYMQ